MCTSLRYVISGSGTSVCCVHLCPPVLLYVVYISGSLYTCTPLAPCTPARCGHPAHGTVCVLLFWYPVSLGQVPVFGLHTCIYNVLHLSMMKMTQTKKIKVGKEKKKEKKR